MREVTEKGNPFPLERVPVFQECVQFFVELDRFFHEGL